MGWEKKQNKNGTIKEKNFFINEFEYCSNLIFYKKNVVIHTWSNGHCFLCKFAKHVLHIV